MTLHTVESMSLVFPFSSHESITEYSSPHIKAAKKSICFLYLDVTFEIFDDCFASFNNYVADGLWGHRSNEFQAFQAITSSNITQYN